MAKLIMGLGALFLYGSLGMTAGVGHAEPEQPCVESTAAQDGTPLGGISQDERERRVRECETMHDHCYDQCTRFHGKNKPKLVKCYVDCADDLQECMKKIPYAD